MIVKVKEIPVRHDGVKYVKDQEFQVNEKQFERLKAHVVFVSEDPVQVTDDKPIDKMTVAELKEYAELHNIELGEASKKEEILEVIKLAFEE